MKATNLMVAVLLFISSFSTVCRADSLTVDLTGVGSAGMFLDTRKGSVDVCQLHLDVTRSTNDIRVTSVPLVFEVSDPNLFTNLSALELVDYWSIGYPIAEFKEGEIQKVVVSSNRMHVTLVLQNDLVLEKGSYRPINVRVYSETNAFGYFSLREYQPGWTNNVFKVGSGEEVIPAFTLPQNFPVMYGGPVYVLRYDRQVAERARISLQSHTFGSTRYLQLNCVGEPMRPYHLEESLDLVSWNRGAAGDISSLQSIGSPIGIFSFGFEMTTVAPAQRFYRVVSDP